MSELEDEEEFIKRFNDQIYGRNREIYRRNRETEELLKKLEQLEKEIHGLGRDEEVKRSIMKICLGLGFGFMILVIWLVMDK